MWLLKDVATIKVCVQRGVKGGEALGFLLAPVRRDTALPRRPERAGSQPAPRTTSSIYSYLLKQHRVCELPLGQK